MISEEMWETAFYVWTIGSQELARLAETVDKSALTRCVERIAACRGRIVTMGCGTSAAAARKIAHTLSCIERPAFYLSPPDAAHGALGVVQPGDIAILISKGGGSKELLDLVPSLHAKKVLLIGVTENKDSPIARESDLLMKVKVEREADEFNMLATTSTMAVIAVFDAVAVAVMRHTGYTREQIALIYTSGAVGERLLGKKT